MTKSSLSTIYSVLTAVEFDNKEAVMGELSKELNRYAEQKEQKAHEYEQVKEIVFQTLRDAKEPMPLAQIWSACKEVLPESCSRNKVQYGLTKLWADEITITKGKVNAYSL